MGEQLKVWAWRAAAMALAAVSIGGPMLIGVYGLLFWFRWGFWPSLSLSEALGAAFGAPWEPPARTFVGLGKIEAWMLGQPLWAILLFVGFAALPVHAHAERLEGDMRLRKSGLKQES